MADKDYHTSPDCQQITSIIKPHELAPHVGALFRILPPSDMRPVKIAMDAAIKLLVTAEPIELDITNPDYGIPYALEVSRKHEKEEIKAACELLRMCLHAIERGETAEAERHSIPVLLSSLVGFVPDRNARAAKRPRSKKEDALDRGIKDALKALPCDANWTHIEDWLFSEGVIEKCSDEKKGNREIVFTDGENSTSIRLSTFRNRITNLKKKLKIFPD
ncbi:MAG: hypothetical protein NMNS01_24890 [Nitrosomonas sp.]|nr:MAG: hypothetical protein NMNS01_24890 [Nitrosomonas sp.]